MDTCSDVTPVLEAIPSTRAKPELPELRGEGFNFHMSPCISRKRKKDIIIPFANAI